jgi:hypothetical protein
MTLRISGSTQTVIQALLLAVCSMFFSDLALAQACTANPSTDPAKITSASNTKFMPTGNNQCLQITSTGSVDTNTSSGIQVQNGISGFRGTSINNEGSVTNTNTSGNGYGIVNNQGGTIVNLTNSGSVSVTGANNTYGIYNLDSGSTISNLTNSGSVLGTATSINVNGYGISNDSAIGSLTNTSTGHITGSASGTATLAAGISTYGTITTLTNSGSITTSGSPTRSYAIEIEGGGSISTLNNNSGGSISSVVNSRNTTGVGISLGYGATVSSLTNGGTISSSGATPTGSNSGIYLGTTSSSIDTITNSASGVISGTGGYSSYGIYNNGLIRTIGNNGAISASSSSSDNSGISNQSGAVISSITNNGTISATGARNAGINNAGTISTLTNNNGVISGGGTYGGIFNPGTITTLTNNGTISGQATYSGIYNGGTITTLNNAQGGDGLTAAKTALTLHGSVPLNYNIIITDSSHYGQLSVTGATGSSFNFGISSASITSPGGSPYTAVLTGITNSMLGAAAGSQNYSGTSNGYGYNLHEQTSSTSNIWDLTVQSTPIVGSGRVYQSSNLGSTVNPIFDGGTLQVSGAGNINQNFTANNNSGVIDQHGYSSNFTGNITDATSTRGKITIMNTGTAGSGSVTLSGINTHSGGTEVDAGATLSIASSGALGSGTLALVGSSTIPATLNVTASTTISNPITVAGDPIFNIASGTTTTVSSPITNGTSAGDVVVQGGGTLALTAANTYTGLTNIAAGSTLALTGAGSIDGSSSLTNNGTFNIVNKTGNASAANYTQSTTGTLVMAFSPASNQLLKISGTTSLAGGLVLSAGAGTYSAGKYTLLTSANGLSGTFSAFSSNLSSYTRLAATLSYDANDVYLNLFAIIPPAPTGPSLENTQASVANSAQALQGTYTLQNSILANSLSYDCTIFGSNNICVSAGGRNTAISATNGLNNTSALLIAAYRAMPSVRIGAYADQNLSVNNAGSTVNSGNNTPLLGLFAAWNEKQDGTGTEVKASLAYGQKSTTINRQVVGTGATASEAGSGGSTLSSQGAQVTAKYGFGVAENVVFSPYIGMRYTQNNMGGYTEAASAAVTAPLTYSALNTNATTALAGLGASYRFIPKATVFAGAGVETDTNTANGTYAASGLAGLTPINFNANPVKTRPTATLGAYYDVEKNQRLGITGIYRQEPFQAVSTTTVMATYTVGL